MNYLRAQKVVHRQIMRFGGIQQLRRDITPRDCAAATLDWATSDREGSLIQHGDLRVLISGYSLLGMDPPDVEEDVLLLDGVVYKIMAPASMLCPDNVTILYWELQARL